MLQEIRRRSTGSELDIMEQERKRREELYQVQLNERSQSHENLLQVQEHLLKIFAKLKVCLELSNHFRLILYSIMALKRGSGVEAAES